MKEMVEGMDSGLVGLRVKGLLVGKSLTMYKN